MADDNFEDPARAVAVIAHELAHVLLLGNGYLGGHEKDHEELTDLLTVFSGLGIFTANAAFQFKQWSEEMRQAGVQRKRGENPRRLR